MIIRMTRSTQLLFGTRSNELRELISRTAHLRKIQRSKYDKLYSQPEKVDKEKLKQFLISLDLLSKGSEQNRYRPITKDELDKAIGRLVTNKSPVSNGYPIEWYK